ncbi:hypothetical protein BDV34DRAFT_203419 [Aspergillus parasiticus]|uniref:Uncharacterized protein n=1 Tax=Aspergillus parasiticus TaxID=5067 RepID=A0A5N6D794_ASPPA|nr:hypothetical protein BDV34DRAFT_203419 [Aspergillus parasiticus]
MDRHPGHCLCYFLHQPPTHLLTILLLFLNTIIPAPNSIPSPNFSSIQPSQQHPQEYLFPRPPNPHIQRTPPKHSKPTQAQNQTKTQTSPNQGPKSPTAESHGSGIITQRK